MTGGIKRWQEFQLRRVEVGALSARLDDWKQGDLIKDVPISWLVNYEDSVTPLATKGVVPSFHNEAVVAEYAIVCSQTCDISGEFIGERHPYVLLAPLSPISSIADQNLRANVLAGETGYLFPIPAKKSFAKRDSYFVDLRAIFTVSKAYLASSKRIDGVLDEKQSLQFAEFLAAKFRRVSLSDALSGLLSETLKTFIDALSPKHSSKLEQVRVLISDGDRLNPSTVIIYVLHRTNMTKTEMDEWNAWKDAAKPLFAQENLTISSLVFDDPKIMTADTYRKTVPLNRVGLGGERFW